MNLDLDNQGFVSIFVIICFGIIFSILTSYTKYTKLFYVYKESIELLELDIELQKYAIGRIIIEFEEYKTYDFIYRYLEHDFEVKYDYLTAYIKIRGKRNFNAVLLYEDISQTIEDYDIVD